MSWETAMVAWLWFLYACSWVSFLGTKTADAWVRGATAFGICGHTALLVWWYVK